MTNEQLIVLLILAVWLHLTFLLYRNGRKTEKNHRQNLGLRLLLSGRLDKIQKDIDNGFKEVETRLHFVKTRALKKRLKKGNGENEGFN